VRNGSHFARVGADMELTGEIRWAALQAVAQHLGGFADSMACEDIWENNPELEAGEMETATRLAEQIADSTRNALLQGFTPVEVTTIEGESS
jgi:hypothetical protein